jgi:hypothetical protein
MDRALSFALEIIFEKFIFHQFSLDKSSNIAHKKYAVD